ncbi:energy transducer TonB [Mucilaginibacter myungsuensis]|uniref:Energy transducer TonB n=1 Tax=Mucilaginibacter myungsuensis TaxID=649104 RepID=A0A929KTJ4_9SPHI|nr:energy transducer TonB [Mucilaginibacter myungsuensis]MBE9660527.1 energy transducer TonB [Mucilaginibacter myungsuensis]MDN3600572.1 energy transducer TonB [Mucilaginibacter myungsuensis]
MKTLSAIRSNKFKFALITGLCCVASYTASAQDVNSVKPAKEIADPETANRSEASFPGGMSNFYGYLASQIKLDSTCHAGRKVQVAFMVDKKGKVRRAKVDKHVLSEEMNKQLVRIFEGAPQWDPARQNGHDIKSYFVCPIVFMPKRDLMASNQPVKQ